VATVKKENYNGAKILKNMFETKPDPIYAII
jgi:hypothetical protein